MTAVLLRGRRHTEIQRCTGRTPLPDTRSGGWGAEGGHLPRTFSRSRGCHILSSDFRLQSMRHCGTHHSSPRRLARLPSPRPGHCPPRLPRQQHLETFTEITGTRRSLAGLSRFSGKYRTKISLPPSGNCLFRCFVHVSLGSFTNL